MNMKHFTLLLVFAVGLLGPQALSAANYAVGTCKPNVPSYPTISAAVGTVPPGSTVLVCPGAYAEQVTITQSLTLEGIKIGSGGRAVIDVPSGGLTTSVTSVVPGKTVYPQVLVTATAGPVNITNITVDGTNNDLDGSAYVAGIFYGSGSYGTVDHVTAREQIDDGEGAGIWAENGNATMDTVTIENCDVHDVDRWGIFVASTQTPATLDATIQGNDVQGGPAGPIEGIYSFGGAGTITNNVVTDTLIYGIFGYGFTGSILNNTITNTEANSNASGMDLLGSGEVVKGNTITNNNGSSSAGILINDSTATIEENKITNSNVGIEFNCNTSTVSANAITDAAIAIDQVPSGLTVTNTYYDVDTIRTECTSDAAAKRAAIAARLKKLAGIP
jgi:Right handed beta helix region